MKNRISKKKHKEFLMSALYYASMSNDFRPKLLRNGTFSVEISDKTVQKSEVFWAELHKWKLEYVIEVAKDHEISRFPYFEGCILFKCYPKRYPWIHEYSGINPEVIVT